MTSAATDAWREEARRLYLHGIPRREIQSRFGKGEKAVRNALRGITPPAMARKSCTVKVCGTFVHRRSDDAPRQTAKQRRRERLHQLLTADRNNRTPAPISLPRVSLQEMA